MTVFRETSRFTPDYEFIAGDFNFAMEPAFERQGTSINNNKARDWVSTKIKANQLADVFREVHPETPGFTWCANRPHPMFSRLDYWLITEAALQYVRNIEILPSYNSDHSLVVMTLAFEPFKRGPGYWKLNTTLLRDPDYVEAMNKLIDIELSIDTPSSYRDKWELIKLAVRNSTLQYTKRKQNSNKQKLLLLEKKLHRLHKELINAHPLNFSDTKEQIRLVKSDIDDIIACRTKGAILRSRAQWEFSSDKPTKYFLSLEKKNFQNKTIYALDNDQGRTINDEKQILKEIRLFYEQLYTSSVKSDTSYIKKLKDIPQVPKDKVKELDSPITVQELGTALFAMPNNKCSGTDGLPADFYKVFWPKLKCFLGKYYQEVVEEGIFNLSARRGILSLLEKLNKNTRSLLNWRPLSLLCTENKIYTKVLANRLQKVSNDLVHHTQTGFMKSRLLAENILKILEVMNKCDKERQNAILMSFDFYKAFDTVEWKAIYDTLQAFGFGKKYIDMVRIIYNKPLMTAMNNGFWSEWFTPTRGVRQGCCFSPGIFTLVVELLSIGIRENPLIQGVKIGNSEVKIGQFADDLWATLLPTPDNIENYFTRNTKLWEIFWPHHKLSKNSNIKIGSIQTQRC